MSVVSEQDECLNQDFTRIKRFHKTVSKHSPYVGLSVLYLISSIRCHHLRVSPDEAKLVLAVFSVHKLSAAKVAKQ